MEKLTIQLNVFNNIKSLCANYSKDSSSRKTDEYLKKRLDALEEYWNDFGSRHAILLQEVEEKNIKYFTDDVYSKTEQMYTSVKTDILQRLKESEAKSISSISFDLTGLPEVYNENYTELLRARQENNIAAFNRAMSKINLTTTTEKWELEDHLSTLKSKWEPIEKLHWELQSKLPGSSTESYDVLFLQTEENYDQLRKTLKSKIHSTNHYQQSTPRVEIPEFSGDYRHWISFKDLFMETIHNNPTINNAQKMQHLKTKLRGEAERIVQYLTISADNYDSCWELLSQRFDNRHLQFYSFMNAMDNLPTLKQQDANKLKKMHDVINEAMNGIRNIGLDTTKWDPVIVYYMSRKLDSTTYGDFLKSIPDKKAIPQLNNFMTFLEESFLTNETKRNTTSFTPNTHSNKQEPNGQKSSYDNKPNYTGLQKPVYNKTYHTTYGQCLICNDDHVVMQCPKFIAMDTNQRYNTVKKLQVCKNCLFSHGNQQCKSTKTCKECNMKHHTLLHFTKKPASTTNTNEKTNDNSKMGQRSSNHISSTEKEVLLTTVQLEIKSVDGTFIKFRGLLDQGSQVNIISERAAQLLRLPRQKLNANISGIGSSSGECKGRVQLNCKSIHSDYMFETQALVMKKITNNPPMNSFEDANWPHLSNINLADPHFNISRPIEFLLGADAYGEIILEGVLKGQQHTPFAQQTQIGWILCGKLHTYNCHVLTSIDLSELTRFWESEVIVQTQQDAPQDQQCEEFFNKTTKRDSDGKYTVQMPLLPDFHEKLGNSKNIATSQFLQLEKRLARTTKLAAMYKDFMREYEDLEHMAPCKTATLKTQCYLPHHGVLRESSTSTKLRTVFNASQKTSSGYSLNNVLEKGPNLQKDIQMLIMKWRTYQYAYTADIEKMYRCIWIAEEQQDLQKIIWRPTPSEPLQEYKLRTITYGTKCAPWLAMRTLKQLAIDDAHLYPAAAQIVKDDFYVDDLISGHHSLEDAIQLQQELIQLLKLRKWTGNHKSLLENLTSDQLASNTNFNFKSDVSQKTLGLGWNPETDAFNFDWALPNNTKLTKRTLLSEIAKLYDPLGWLSPVTVSAKLHFQKIWVGKHQWDENLPRDIQEAWLKLKSELPLIQKLTLKRWIAGSCKNIELLGFCDASEKAFNENGEPMITLFAARTRVAPLAQKTTLPRMELCGALLLAELMGKAKLALSNYTLTIRAWCDSQVALAWIQGETSRWEPFVVNRVTKIKQQIPKDNWAYIKSEQNPADCASRGLYPRKLLNFSLWWQGPDFLNNIESQNIKENLTSTYETNLGCKTKQQCANITITSKQKEHFINNLLQNNSSLCRVTRVVAWVLRGIAKICHYGAINNTKYLKASELLAANEQIIKCTQQTEFKEELKLLQKNENISAKSSIFKLNPYLDEKGIIRVGGRLNKSSLPSGMINPIILSRTGRLTKLIIEQAHHVTLHGGARLTLTYIRQRYWIVGGNRAVKAQLLHCIRCRRFSPTQNHQFMGDLPEQRITPSKPFTHTGVDFTGHVDVKLNKGRGVKTSKGYIAIFICMATKAVHIELVSDLSTETFIAAFQRLCARRGTPKHMYSDCGTNFIGASRQLQGEFREFKKILTEEFFSEISKMEVEWHFNAPAWPTAGGLWEAAVKSTKHHLRRVLGDQKLTYEEFSTLLTRIEACLNSRPLCPLTEDPEEFYNSLTPGHFLTGGPTLNLPLSDYNDIRRIDIRQRWQLTEHLSQQFWKNWSTDYLHLLQTRCKWNKPTKNIKEGDIVLVKENNLPPGKWAMGRITEVHPGDDGYVRVTTLKTQNGTIKRPVTKLSLLPLEIEDQQQKEENKTTKNNFGKVKRVPKKISYLSLLGTLLMLFSLMMGAHALPSHTQITNMEADRPIYYDTIGKLLTIHDEWTLVMYYNLTNYWEGTRRISTYVRDINELCMKTNPRYCKTTLDQLHHEIGELTYYNNILLAPHTHLSASRKKRGLINGVGYIANSLFGVLDERFAEKYQNDIEEVRANENYLLQLMKNQTSIIELQNTILKRNEDNIQRQFDYIGNFINETNQNMNTITEEIEIAMASTYFNSASLSAYMLINNLKTIQEMLFNTLTDVYKGHIDVHLITPVNLIQQLTKINGKLPKTLSIPVNNIKQDIRDIYKFLYVKARVTEEFFLFEIHIPLISDEEYILYHAIPLPIKIRNETVNIKTKSSYIAANFKKNTYISLEETALNMCTKQSEDVYICHKNLPVFNLHNNKTPCEATLLGHPSTLPCDVTVTTCKEQWIELHTTNSWLASCCETCTLRTICNSDISSYTITGNAIITIAQGCVLQSSDLTIFAHNKYSSRATIDYELPQFAINTTVNNIVNITYAKILYMLPNENTEIDQLKKQIMYQKQREEYFPSTISSHDVHQYAVSYSMVALVLVAGLFWVGRKRCRSICSKKSNAVRALREEIELTVLKSELSQREVATKRTRNETSMTTAPGASSQRDFVNGANNLAFNFD